MSTNRRRGSSRRGLRHVRTLLLAGLALLVAGCDDGGGVLARFLLKSDDIIIERRPDPAYDRLFPYYVELCTISQFSRKDGRRGNPFGHALMYIKGACKDEDAPFPQLRRCRSVATSLDDPEHGAAVSVGRWLKNVNWVAIPGYKLVFTGNLEPGERLTSEHFDATVTEAIDRGVYDGVELHPGWKSRDDSDLREYVADHSITADFALQFARNVFCSRIPVTEPVLDEVVAFLNEKNYEYATGDVEYNWSLFSHNCVHTVRNALAAANFWSPLSVLGIEVLHLFRLAVPANEFVNLAILGADGPIGSYRAIGRERPSRDALLDFRWLPTRHGALVKTLPVHEPNDIYHTAFRLFAVQSPLSMGHSANAVRLLADPRYVDLGKNLAFFRDRYDAILSARDTRIDWLESVRGTPLRRLDRVHHAYIETQRQDAESLLQRYTALQVSPQACDRCVPQ
jgi:hypothetical protein